MKNKYFINFIHGYFKSLHSFVLVENYHLYTFLVAKQAGFNNFVAIVKKGTDILRADPNLKVLQDEYGINIIILDHKNIVNFKLLVLKYSQSKALSTS